ncbi:hypothetical protein I4U23_015765 [Adineta vaga]|nr:hypothetical protein I4U23_015765 [Adineta vaga]
MKDIEEIYRPQAHMEKPKAARPRMEMSEAPRPHIERPKAARPRMEMSEAPRPHIKRPKAARPRVNQWTAVKHNRWLIFYLTYHRKKLFVTTLDCSSYANDQEVLATFPFSIPFLPWTDYSPIEYDKTSGRWDFFQRVDELVIVNENYIPPTIFCLRSLQNLYIRNSSFYTREQDATTNFPLPIGTTHSLYSLRSLRIYDTPVTHLPEEISSLYNLETLELSNTGLVSLPSNIGRLTSLNHLSLIHQQFSTLPKTLMNLEKLFYLEISHNPNLHSLESLNGHRSIGILIVNHCGIEYLPDDLPNLSQLYLSYNKLTDLDGIRNLGYNTELKKVFYFDNNQIQSVSTGIRNVKNLHTLNLARNELTKLSPVIFNISTMRYLDIKDNHFNKVEQDIIIEKFKISNQFLTFSI